MAEQIIIEKLIYADTEFKNVINTDFSELVPPTSSLLPISVDINISEFFNQYDTLFFSIPPSGSDESHLGLATKSLEYLGLSLDNLQNEINLLRQENTELKNQIIQISNIDIKDLEEI